MAVKESAIEAGQFLIALLSAKKIQELILAALVARRRKQGDYRKRFAYFQTVHPGSYRGLFPQPEGVGVGRVVIEPSQWEAMTVDRIDNGEKVWVLWRTELSTSRDDERTEHDKKNQTKES